MIKSGLVSQHRARFENGYPHMRNQYPRNETIRPGYQATDMPILEKSDYAQPLKMIKSENEKLDLKRNPDAQVYYDQLFSNTLGPSDRFYLASLIDRIGRSGSTVNIVNNTRVGSTPRLLDNLPEASDAGGSNTSGGSSSGTESSSGDPTRTYSPFQEEYLNRLFLEDPNLPSVVFNEPLESMEQRAVSTIENTVGQLRVSPSAPEKKRKITKDYSYEESDKSFEFTPSKPERKTYSEVVSSAVEYAVDVNAAANSSFSSSSSKKSFGAQEYKPKGKGKAVTPSNIKTRSKSIYLF